MFRQVFTIRFYSSDWAVSPEDQALLEELAVDSQKHLALESEYYSVEVDHVFQIEYERFSQERASSDNQLCQIR